MIALHTVARPRILSARGVLVALFAAAVALGPAAAAGARPLKVSLAGNVVFPDRTLLLSAPSNATVNQSEIAVTENGHLVKGATLTSLRHASAGDFGVVLVIDSDPSMGGPPLAHAMAAARAFAGQRKGLQELGVIFGDGTSLPLTSDSAAIHQALRKPPKVVPRTNLLASMETAVNELAGAHIADGAVIFVSDDIDRDPTYTPQSVAAYAAAAHVRIYTVGIKDPAYAHRNPQDLPPDRMAQLANQAGGFFASGAPADLTRIFTALESGLVSQYVVHYRSRQPFGTARIDLMVRVLGIPGSSTIIYSSPARLARPQAGAVAHRQSFWRSSLALILVSTGGALLLGLAALLLLSHFLRRRSVVSRVAEFVDGPRRPGRPSRSAGEERQRASSLLTRRPWWPGFVESVEIARLGRSPFELVYLAAIAAFLFAALLIVLTGSILIGILGLAVGPFGLRALVSNRVRHQRARFSEQLPSHLEEVSGAIRSGRSLVDALSVVSADADEPMRGEFDRALVDESLGLPLEDTLQPIAVRMQADGMEQFAVVAAMHRRTGSSLAEVLEQIAAGARERDELRRELISLTAQGRLSRWILTAMPPVMLLAFALINPKYVHPMFHTTGGLIALGIGTVMVIIGSFAMKQIVEIDV